MGKRVVAYENAAIWNWSVEDFSDMLICCLQSQRKIIQT